MSYPRSDNNPTDEYYEQYEELIFELTGENSSDIAVMFGYPATQHGDCEYEAALRLVRNITIP